MIVGQVRGSPGVRLANWYVMGWGGGSQLGGDGGACCILLQTPEAFLPGLSFWQFRRRGTVEKQGWWVLTSTATMDTEA